MNRDDPNLTAYALGETELLSATERHAIERLLEESAEARAFVAETAAFAEMLQGEFRKELSGVALPPAARARLLEQSATTGARGVLVRFPGVRRMAWVAGLGAVAAAIAVAFWLPFAAEVTPERSGGVATDATSAREATQETASGVLGGDFPGERAVAKSGEPVDERRTRSDEVLEEGTVFPIPSVATGAPLKEVKTDTALAPAAKDARDLAMVETDAGPGFEAHPVRRGAKFNLKIEPLGRKEAKAELYAKLHADRERPVEFVAAAQNPSSTFFVGPAPTATVRSLLDAGRQPPAGAVRIGEWLDYFYAAPPLPGEGGTPSVRVEVGECPWAPAHRLVWIGPSGPRAAKTKAGAEEAETAERAEVALQMEFNPRAVEAYRLIGEENGSAAGVVPARHAHRAHRALMALYEVIPLSASGKELEKEPRRLLTVTLRQEGPEGGSARVLVEKPVADRGTPLAESSPDFRFAAALAEFWILLENPGRAGGATWASVRELALHGQGSDPDGRRAAFLRLLEKTTGQPGGETPPRPGRE